MSSADDSTKKSILGLRSGLLIGSIITFATVVVIMHIGYNTSIFYNIDADPFTACNYFQHGCQETVPNNKLCTDDAIQVDKTIFRTYCEWRGDYTGKYTPTDQIDKEIEATRK